MVSYWGLAKSVSCRVETPSGSGEAGVGRCLGLAGKRCSSSRRQEQAVKPCSFVRNILKGAQTWLSGCLVWSKDPQAAVPF